MEQATTELIFDDGKVGAYPADLYACDAVAGTLDGLDAIGEREIALYREMGFLAIDNAFSPDEVDSARQGLLDLIDGRNPDFQGVQFETRARDILPTLSPEQKQDAVRKLMWYVEYDARLKAMSQHPKLMALVTRLLSLADGSAPTLFQDMALIKPPRIGREKPWHQDHAYFNFPLGTPVVGAWIALDEASVDNGCMHVAAGAHRQGPRLHFQRRDWQLCDTERPNLPRVTAVPLKPGGVLVFDGLLPHGTPANQSPTRRRALQFHYCPDGVVKWSTEERLAIFGSEGKDAEC